VKKVSGGAKVTRMPVAKGADKNAIDRKYGIVYKPE
jgi:hypothetical protein